MADASACYNSYMASAHSDFGGQERFQAVPAALFAELTDLDRMAATIPDLVSSEKIDDRTLKCVVKPGFSFLRGTLKLTISLTSLEPPSHAAMTIDAQGIGAAMQIVSEMAVSPEGAGSRLDWNARLESARGLLASVPGGLVKAAADQLVRQTWQRVRERLGEGESGA